MTSWTGAQNVVSGVVKDQDEGFPIPYVKITCNCLNDPVMTDAQGKYSIKLSKDNCVLTFETMGYAKEIRAVTFYAKKRNVTLDVKLYAEAKVLDEAQVVTSKYEKEPEKSTSSIVVIDPKKSVTKNVTTADQLVNTAGGIAVVDNEPQIRGGSGFSSGMGSRVMIMLDDMPLLRPDAGRPMWNFIPMEDVEQVDIMKGAASVVFGSSALTGAINVLTAYPRSKPKTKVTAFAGIYSKPKDERETSWNHRNPVKYGISFLHSRIIKKNFDLVVGGEFFNDEGYIGPEQKIADTRDSNGNTRGKYEKRGRVNFATRYRFEKVKGLSISVNGNFMYTQNAQSFFWNDGYENKYRSYKGSLSQFRDFTFYIDPTLKYVGPRGFVHSFKNRIIFSDNAEISGAQSARSTMVYDEYQVNKTIKKIGMNIVAGVMNMYTTSYGACFNGVKGSNVPMRVSSDNISLYAQLEEKLLKNKNLTLQFGARWEFYKLFANEVAPSEFEHKPVFRAGINYQLNKSKTSFRASIGQGYRYPSIGEKYIAIAVGKYGFYPNPNLESENSWNAEIGIMQPFMAGSFRGMVDIAGYNQEFKNFIEFCVGQWGNGSGLMDKLGFMYLNTGPARISGLDVTFMGEGKIGKNVAYNISLSYTYSHPVTKDRNHVYFVHPTTGKEYNFTTTASDTTRNVLKYRIEHMAKLDVEFSFFKTFAIGVSANYFSAMKNVDDFFFNYDAANPENSETRNRMLMGLDLPFYGYYDYFHSHDKGSFVLDARVSFFIKDFTLSFIVKNVLNECYYLRPMYMEPTRTFTFQLVYDLH
ncbi:MAG: TonB-dependent receptor [Bacteroidales bacterium]|nr:TonB-dependent receptor [Bacteroidales bacterium]